MTVLRCLLVGSMFAAPIVAAAQTSPRTGADAPPMSSESPSASLLWQNYFRRIAGEYRMTAGTASEPLTLLDKPVLKWNQPVRGGEDGAVYLWVERERPAVIGTFFIWPYRDGRLGCTHELQRLTNVSVAGQWRNKIRWQPKDDSVQWHAVPASPRPDEDASRRAVQARKIARRFTAGSVNRQEGKSELRLQPHPFYQYVGAADDKWLGGMLFSIVHGTDTEVVLWLEARRDEDAPRWHFACARMSDLQLRVAIDDKEVWSADFAKYDQFDQPYLCTAAEFFSAPPVAETDSNPQ